MKKKDGGFPYDETPMVHAFPGNADDCFDMVNQYGTYEIQRTADTGNACAHATNRADFRHSPTTSKSSFC